MPEFITLPHGDGYVASARWWPPAGERTRGAVLYLHGIQSHGEWFERSGTRLAEAGLAVLMPDRRGSGRNDRDRGHAPSAARLVADAGEWLDELVRRSGRATATVIGVSWGGKLALALYRARQPQVGSLALVAPGLFPLVDLRPVEKIQVALALLANRRRPFRIPITEPEMFTANPERIAYIRDDALSLHDVTASFLVASRRLDRQLRSAARWPGVPTHLFLAEHDRIIDNVSTRQWLHELPWPDRTITEYRDASHTLEFEPDGAPFIGDLAAWVSGVGG
ncbi:MAG: alpha/beta fold hydrolase [Phycisphaerae bacterium]|nr:alpha/beta fold hydrolase [Phycisphaerae bacterium]